MAKTTDSSRSNKHIVAHIFGEEVFQVWGTGFITDPLPDGGTLYYGPTADKSTMSAWEEETSADDFIIVKNAVPGMYYYVSGNTGSLKIRYEQCCDKRTYRNYDDPNAEEANDSEESGT